MKSIEPPPPPPKSSYPTIVGLIGIHITVLPVGLGLGLGWQCGWDGLGWVGMGFKDCGMDRGASPGIYKNMKII